MRVPRALETLLVRWLAGAVRARPWERSLVLGERLGDLARGLGIRRRVAEENLARAFPERTAEERARILRECYREVGRVAVEYPRMAELARGPRGRVAAAIRGLEHCEALRGKGAILFSGHFGNFELMAAFLARSQPVDVVARALSNPAAEALIASQRQGAGLGVIPAERGIRGVYESLEAGRWVAMLADQDARRHGVFVPFFGRPASTALGPARIALSARVPLLIGFVSREPDGRISLDVDPPLETAGRADTRESAIELTALHTARLEAQVRARPEMWFWLHRRWKTAPPAAAVAPGDPADERDPRAVQGWPGKRTA